MAATAAIAAGGLLKTYSDMEQLSIKQDQLRAQSEAKWNEASELLRRAEINAFSTFAEGEMLKSQQVAELAKSGVAVGTGTSLTILEETSSFIMDSIAKDMEAARYDAMIIQNSARSDLEYARSINKTKKLTMISGVLNTGSSAISAKGY